MYMKAIGVFNGEWQITMNKSLILMMWSSVCKLWTDQTEKWQAEILLHCYSGGNWKKKCLKSHSKRKWKKWKTWDLNPFIANLMQFFLSVHQASIFLFSLQDFRIHSFGFKLVTDKDQIVKVSTLFYFYWVDEDFIYTIILKFIFVYLYIVAKKKLSQQPSFCIANLQASKKISYVDPREHLVFLIKWNEIVFCQSAEIFWLYGMVDNVKNCHWRLLEV